MKAFSTKHFYPPTGFSLIGLMLGVVVICLMAAFIFPIIKEDLGKINPDKTGTPSLGIGMVGKAKVVRAKMECEAIASAIKRFHLELGVWPGAKRRHSVASLVSGGTVSSSVPGRATQYGFKGDGNDDWYDGSGGGVSTLNRHLIQNKEGGKTLYGNGWRGPYLSPIGMDPWGHPYMCNIGAASSSRKSLCVVLSAGPNEVIDTPYDRRRKGPPSGVTSPGGDDLWALVR